MLRGSILWITLIWDLCLFPIALALQLHSRPATSVSTLSPQEINQTINYFQSVLHHQVMHELQYLLDKKIDFVARQDSGMSGDELKHKLLTNLGPSLAQSFRPQLIQLFTKQQISAPRRRLDRRSGEDQVRHRRIRLSARDRIELEEQWRSHTSGQVRDWVNKHVEIVPPNSEPRSRLTVKHKKLTGVEFIGWVVATSGLAIYFFAGLVVALVGAAAGTVFLLLTVVAA